MWPDDRDLPVEVAAAFGANLLADPSTWSWTDLSARLRATPIQVRVPSAQMSPGTCSVSLDNEDGALTPLHPISPYWPNVQRGTPLRVSIRRVDDPFDGTLSAGWGTAGSGQVWSAAGFGGTIAPTDHFTSGGRARQSVPVASAYRLSWLPGLSLRDCRVRLSGMSLPFTDVTGGSVEPGNILLRMQSINDYYMARVEITTAEQVVCKLYNPAGTQLASATVAGLTHSAAQTLEVVAEIVDSTFRMKVWATGGTEPAGWAATATDSTMGLPGGVGVRTGVAAGNTNSKPIVASYESITVYVDRFSGFADQWEPTFLPTTGGKSVSAVRVTASGILRRLGQGTPPARSPLRRTIGAANPAAYWPGEDAAAAQSLASAIPGHPPMTVTGVAEFVEVREYKGLYFTQRPGSASLVNLAKGARLAASVPAAVTAATAAQWTVFASGDIDPAVIAGPFVLLEWTTPGGTYTRWQVTVSAVDSKVTAYTGGGTPTVLFTGGLPFGLAGWSVSAIQSGGNMVLTYRADIDYILTVAGTLTGVTSVSVNPTGQTASDQVTVGHVAVYGDDAAPPGSTALETDPYGTSVFPAALSYRSEAATVRLARLCAEDRVPLTMPSVPAEAVQRMGWQPVGAALDLYRECVDADMGVLHERGFRLAYIPRSSRYNKPVDLTVDLATYCVTRGSSGEVLTPVLDDQDIRNELTVSRADGSSVVAANAESQARNGVYGSSIELNLASDSQLPNQASWRLHAVDSDLLREGDFPLDLAANPGLIDGWLSCGVGSRIVRTNPPSQYGPGPIDRLVEGWSETIGPRSWKVQVTPSPAPPWDVAVWGVARYDTPGSQTAASFVSGTGTALSVAATAGVLWSGADAPFDIDVGGVRLTVTAVSGSSSPQTFTVVATPVNGITKTIPAGTPVRLWQPGAYAL